MNSRIALLGAAAILAMSLAMAGSAQPAASTAPAPDDAPAKALMTETCTHCHDLDVITSQPRKHAEWPGILDRMKANGAIIPDEDYKVLLDYLGRAYSTDKPQ
ncbi:hypothetical protein [Sphingomonas quercus]|uniref:Cytochrome c n=1 Tax=Sphingomonas quercus TaxID=2842451 RepID=A0ABS6BIE4_9SPHN|nr:hypothetical protein [Sphingomonas quercus]MBU3077362.1 hypothetical protein [Sphingomonas quercus]